MHPRSHGCCGHDRAEALMSDDRFPNDEFTQAAVDESRMRAAHAHGTSFLAMLLGGFLIVGIGKMLFGGRRG